MAIEKIKKSVAEFNENLANSDISAAFTINYIKSSGIKLKDSVKTIKDIYDNISDFGKKVHRGRLKEGDIVFCKNADGDFTGIGFYEKEVIEDIKFSFYLCLVKDGAVEIVNRMGLYTDYSFARIGLDKEDKEVEVKKNKTTKK